MDGGDVREMGGQVVREVGKVEGRCETELDGEGGKVGRKMGG
jgi:hypothetical protein